MDPVPAMKFHFALWLTLWNAKLALNSTPNTDPALMAI
jgi:hypothetical protein